MNPKQIKQSYKEQLIKKGVDSQKAELAAENLTQAELRLIGEIWFDWRIILQKLE